MNLFECQHEPVWISAWTCLNISVFASFSHLEKSCDFCPEIFASQTSTFSYGRFCCYGRVQLGNYPPSAPRGHAALSRAGPSRPRGRSACCPLLRGWWWRWGRPSSSGCPGPQGSRPGGTCRTSPAASSACTGDRTGQEVKIHRHLLHHATVNRLEVTLYEIS